MLIFEFLTQRYIIIFTESTSYICNQLNKCGEAIHLVYEMERSLYNDQVIQLHGAHEYSGCDKLPNHSQKSLIQLESTLLDMAATEDLCSGVLYIFPVKVAKYTILR